MKESKKIINNGDATVYPKKEFVEGFASHHFDRRRKYEQSDGTDWTYTVFALFPSFRP